MQGHIRKRGKAKDSWTVVMNMGYDPVTGKRRQVWRTVRGTKREAQELLVNLLHQRQTGVDAPTGRLTVGDFLERWLRDYAQPNTAPKTLRRYSEIVHIHLVPLLGDIPLSKLRPLHVQRAYAEVASKGLSAQTALHCHRVLREALKHAVRWQLLSRNPADAVEPPKVARREITAPTLEELRRLTTAADITAYGVLVHVALLTGLRLGELLGLRWQDVDLERHGLHVRQSCQWLSGHGYTFRQPKTYRSVRPVSLSPLTVERLKRHHASQLEERLAAGPAYQNLDLVFATPIGRPIYPGTLRANWLRILGEAGLRHLRFHDLRHAHASLMLQNGEHPKVVSERLGHSTVAITMDLYSHVMPGIQDEAAARLDALLANG